MSIIYEPKGKAREYSPLSCNLYTGCNHGCVYCYAPGIRRMSREDYAKVHQRRNVLQEFEKDCKKYTYSRLPVLFCFMTDPYNDVEKELRITRDALKLCLKYKIPVQLLTKSIDILNDIDVIKKFKNHIYAGMTITTDNDKDSLAWEPGASLPDERLKVMKKLNRESVPTWASFEPVFLPEQSLIMIEKTLPYIDVYKLGKINNYNEIDKTINWNEYLGNALEILRAANKKIYVKHDLRVEGYKNKLFGNEVIMDEFMPEPYCQQGALF
jgi:DNA repair photolyase